MIKVEKKSGETAKVDLFELEGKVYQIPANPPASLVLRYLKAVREHGEEHASSELLEGLLGEENFEVLASCDYLTMEDFQAIMLDAQKVVMGSIEEAQGKD